MAFGHVSVGVLAGGRTMKNLHGTFPHFHHPFKSSGVWIRLIRKLAECLDGIDVSACQEGDTLEVSAHDAELLIAEGWAENCEEPDQSGAWRDCPTLHPVRAAARATPRDGS